MRRRDHDRIVSDLRREVQFQREQIRDLTDRIMYLTGSTWTPPPASGPAEDDSPDEPFSWAPEQNLDATPVE